MALNLFKPNIGSTGWGVQVNQNWQDIQDLLNGDAFLSGLLLDGTIIMLENDIERINDLQITGDWPQLKATLDTRYYTQEQVLNLIQGATFEYWLSDTAEGVIAGYDLMYPATTGEAQSTAGPITIDADPKLIQTFITEVAQPDFTVLTEGVYTLNIHASATVGANVKAAHIRWALYKRAAAGGAEVLITTSEDSDELTAANLHYDIHAVVPAEEQLLADDRLVLKVYGVRAGAEPANPDVTIYMEGTTSTRMGVRTSLSAFDSRYLLLNGENTMLAALAMGGFDIVNPGDVDGVDVAALKVDVDEFPDQLKQLLTAEIQQLENIGATTISAAQWAWLGSLANLLNLTEAEAAQLLEIGATTISATQWGYLGAMVGPPGIQDGGDPNAWAFDLGDLTTDGAWHDLDFSAFVPAGAIGVYLKCQIKDNIVAVAFGMRKKGYTIGFTAPFQHVQTANVFNEQPMLVFLDGDRKAQYNATNATWTAINIGVAGWWF